MLESLYDPEVQTRSVVVSEGAEYGFARTAAGPRLTVLAPFGSPAFEDLEGDDRTLEDGSRLMVCPTNTSNAAVLRAHFPWLRPRTLGLKTSAGMGDRLGLATPGHVRAVRSAGGSLAPIFAQQSIREMERTGRSAQQVMDDATWGVFAEGWREGFGADADHLKTPEDIDVCIRAGYTFFTFDPGEQVDDSAETIDASALGESLRSLPWERLEDSIEKLNERYLGRSFDLEGRLLNVDEDELHRAAVKYGRAVAHAAEMYRHLARALGDGDFEVEVSVDETDTPTTHAQHLYISKELRRLGVRWVSLAPRYVGQFEKGVDYIGDVREFEADLAVHAAIARSFGPYKLSLHSGSDKFSLYPAMVRQTQGLVHLKTAGTSYLEALRVVAELDPGLFREVYIFARDRYEAERASYHVSASTARAPAPEEVSDESLTALLDQFDAREILHVTFGSVLTERSTDGVWVFYEPLMRLLRENEEVYASSLEAHFLRHLAPLAIRA